MLHASIVVASQEGGLNPISNSDLIYQAEKN